MSCLLSPIAPSISMKASATATNRVGVILVTYYILDAPTALRLIDDFCAASRLVCDCAVIVDNNGALVGQTSSDSRFTIVAGDNTFWEFSGWLQGLIAARNWSKPAVTVMLNDSYTRNWGISAASRFVIRRMHAAALDGRVAGWLDNFSHLRRPRFSRRPNSRLVVLPTSATGLLAASIEAAIRSLTNHLRDGNSLFSAEEQPCIDRWMASQGGRWDSKGIATRSRRIYLEHHILDSLPPRAVVWFPLSWLGSIAYAAWRHACRERR